MSVTSCLCRIALAASLLLAPPAFAADECSAPASLSAADTPLPHFAAALQPGGHLNVLVVGSATVFSPSALQKPRFALLGFGPPTKPRPSISTFPLQMADLLRSEYPGLDVTVTIKGGPGMTAAEMLDILRTEVEAHPHQLVIWQTGTVEAIKHIPVGSFAQTLAAGAAAVAKSGADLVLVDPQYSHFLSTHAKLAPYADAMRQAASRPGTLLFRRFDLTRFWAENGRIDLERTPRGERATMIGTLHACLGARLASLLNAAVKTPS